MAPPTGTGCSLLVVDPLPSWPELLSPQHVTAPARESRHVCAFPAVIAGWIDWRGPVESPHPVAAAAIRKKEAPQALRIGERRFFGNDASASGRAPKVITSLRQIEAPQII